MVRFPFRKLLLVLAMHHEASLLKLTRLVDETSLGVTDATDLATAVALDLLAAQSRRLIDVGGV